MLSVLDKQLNSFSPSPPHIRQGVRTVTICRQVYSLHNTFSDEISHCWSFSHSLLQANAMSKQWVTSPLESMITTMKLLTRCRLTAWISSPSSWRKIQPNGWQRTTLWGTDGWRRSHNTIRQTRNLQVHHSRSKLFTKWVCLQVSSLFVHWAHCGDCVAAPVTPSPLCHLALSSLHTGERERERSLKVRINFVAKSSKLLVFCKFSSSSWKSHSFPLSRANASKWNESKSDSIQSLAASFFLLSSVLS